MNNHLCKSHHVWNQTYVKYVFHCRYLLGCEFSLHVQVGSTTLQTHHFFWDERERVRHLKFETGKESEKLSATLGRCLSLLFDWGAESGVWKSPSAFIRDALPFDTLFGMSLPLPDADHALHHVAMMKLPRAQGCVGDLRVFRLKILQ